MDASNKVYVNPVQAMSQLVKANHEHTIAGRGTGKTEGIISPRSIEFASEMPRTWIGLVGASYVQLMTRILPGVCKGWTDRGFIEGRHYFIGRYAPAAYNWERPFKSTKGNNDYVIHTCFGSGILLISQDRPGGSNGQDLSAILCDEAKFINKLQLDDETIPAMRGMAHLYGKKYCYRAQVFTSDLPNDASGDWLTEPGHDLAKAHEIAQVQNEWNKSLLRVQNGNHTDASYAAEMSKLKRILDFLNEDRKHLYFLQMSSSLANIDILGEDYFADLLKTMNEDQFRQSVLNIRRVRDGRSFYHDMSESIHGYQPTTSGFFMNVGFDMAQLGTREFRMDGEYDLPHTPLFIACDSGGSFNSMTIATFIGGQLKLINNIYKHHPGKIKDVVLEFKRYYLHHSNKVVNYFFDHTQIATRAESEYTVHQIVVNTLRSDEHGSWHVNAYYYGQTPDYKFRFEFWSSVLRGMDDTIRSFRFNVLNAKETYESCVAAPVKDVQGKIEKDKSSEKKDRKGNFKVSQERATHLSEALDMLACGIKKYAHKLDKGSDFYV